MDELIDKLMFWLFTPRKEKTCNMFCPSCEFYKMCKADVEYQRIIKDLKEKQN